MDMNHPPDRMLLKVKPEIVITFKLLYKYITGSVELGIVLSFFFLWGCGIPTYPHLDPPESSTIKEPLEAEKIFQFGNNPDNNANYFEGYELYYKFYSTDPSDTNLEEEKDSIDLNPSLEKLLLLKYNRMYSLDDLTQSPLIPIYSENKKESFYIYIDFSGITLTLNPYPVVRHEYLAQEIKAARYVSTTDPEYKELVGFSPSDLTAEYSDISEDIISEFCSNIYLVLYVLTYGSYDLIHILHSKPAYLGKIILPTD